MINNFRKKRGIDSRPKYLKYDDVFMSKNSSIRQNREKDQRSYAFNENNSYRADKSQVPNDQYDDGRDNIDFNNYDSFEELHQNQEHHDDNTYFSNNSNIIDEKMVKFQRRQLPPLQRYSDNNKHAGYGRLPLSPYWEDNDEYRVRPNKSYSALANVWQKFLITFTSILSLVCLSWIAYNWNSDKPGDGNYSNTPVIIEPESDDFKVLPENPNIDSVPYTDKSVYEKVMSRGAPGEQGETLLPPIEDPIVVPQSSYNSQDSIEEYSIVEDKIYYIKMSAGKRKDILDSEAKLLKKKYGKIIGDKSCAVKKVSNSQGEKKHAILIGPFDSQERAAYIARELGGQCYIISVKE